MAPTFNGKPCKHGHGTLRYASKQKQCVECSKLHTKRSRARPEYRAQKNARARKYYASTPSLKHRECARLRAKLPQPTRPESNQCECCGKPSTAIRHFGKLCLDHCHETNKFRGWLCFHCNTAIGKLGDNEAGLLRALDYIRRSYADQSPNN